MSEVEVFRFEVTQDMRDYLELIDTKYAEAKKKRLSRFSLEWGKWSAEMNRETRPKCEAGDDQSIGYKYIFLYWTLMSQLLELHHKHKFTRQAYKREIAKTAKLVKRGVLAGKAPDPGGMPELRGKL